jgi:Creatinine amidohydrolase
MRAADAAFTMPRIRASANRAGGNTLSPGWCQLGGPGGVRWAAVRHRAVCRAEPMHYGDCTYQEIAALADDGAVAVVPLGCTEQQGAHLPVDFDTWFSGALAAAAAGQAEPSIVCVS